MLCLLCFVKLISLYSIKPAVSWAVTRAVHVKENEIEIEIIQLLQSFIFFS